MQKFTSKEKIDLLRSVELFRETSESTLMRLADLSEEVSLASGEDIIVQGKRCPNLYVLISGQIGIYMIFDGREREAVRLSDRGKVVGEIGVISGAVSSATIRTLSDESHFLRISEGDFQSVVKNDPQLAEAVLRSLARYL